jgi:hypothetical protein
VAKELRVQEIVVPDTLGDANDTIAKGLSFSRYTRSGYRYMMVAQGKNVMECIQTLDMIATDSKFMYVTTVGIPRLINKEDRFARYKVATYIERIGLNRALEVHFLGASKNVEEVGYLAEIGVGRGIDTSAPIYIGMKDYPLSQFEVFKANFGSRPRNFFRSSVDTPMIGANIETYLGWANYDRDAPLPERSEEASTS